MSNAASALPLKHHLKRFFKWGFFSSMAALGIFIILDLLGFVTVGDAVEMFRKITGEPGTKLVRWAEEIYFEARYDASVWWRGEESAPTSKIAAKQLVVQAPKNTAKAAPASTSAPTSQPKIKIMPTQGEIPWAPYTRTDGSEIGIYTAQIFPNDKLPDQPVYLAWMDPTELAFRWIPGIAEPEPDPTFPVQGPVDRSGIIPKKEWPKLVAAFNGGYLTKHGHFGAKFDGTVILPPRENFATAALTADGRINIGAWGRDIDPKDKSIVTYRQNLRLIVDGGEVPADVRNRSRGAIRPDASLSDPLEGDLKAHTWRSGIGISKTGALIFAAGDFLDGELLGVALQKAGAERAMQLDVNAPYFCVFLFFEPIDDQGNLEGLVLGPKMTPRSGQFVTSRNGKDFVYVTKR